MEEKNNDQLLQELEDAMHEYLSSGKNVADVSFRGILTLATTLHEAGCIELTTFLKNFIRDLKK